MQPASFPRVTLPGLATPEQTAEVDRLVEAARVERDEKVAFSVKRLLSLHRKGKHVYGFTVTAKTKAARRAAGKVAKASRKVNR